MTIRRPQLRLTWSRVAGEARWTANSVSWRCVVSQAGHFFQVRVDNVLELRSIHLDTCTSLADAKRAAEAYALANDPHERTTHDHADDEQRAAHGS